MKGRPCVVYEYTPGTTEKRETGRGVFHQWSTNFQEMSEGVGQYPVAIIELDTGQVACPFVELVRFDDGR